MAPSAGPSASRRRRRPTHRFDDPLEPGPLVALLEQTHARAWDPFRDLDWSTEVAWTELTLPGASCLVTQFDAYARMSPEERRLAKVVEMASHLSSLADGEKRAADLAAATALLDPPTTAHLWFLSGLMADEAKHYAVLVHYLQTKLQLAHAPTTALARVFAELQGLESFELNVVAGQLVLEATASALLASLLATVREPLLHSALRHIMRDEGRHMSFARALSRRSSARLPDRPEIHEVLFDAAWAGAASLLALDAWEQLGIPRHVARQQAVDALARRGFLAFYKRVILESLRLQGYRTGALGRLLEEELEQRLRSPH
jgi:hypothetical protein